MQRPMCSPMTDLPQTDRTDRRRRCSTATGTPTRNPVTVTAIDLPLKCFIYLTPRTRQSVDTNSSKFPCCSNAHLFTIHISQFYTYLSVISAVRSWEIRDLFPQLTFDLSSMSMVEKSISGKTSLHLQLHLTFMFQPWLQVHAGIGRTPFEAMFGTSPRLGLLTWRLPAAVSAKLETEEQLRQLLQDDSEEQPEQQANEAGSSRENIFLLLFLRNM